jgi:FkbM family methyltransferase
MNNLAKWFNDNGDNTLRLDYDLNDNSIVFDLGGYHGGWAKNIIDIYNCNIYIFEPFINYFNLIKDKFNSNDKVKIYNFGLSNKTSEELLYISEDGSSIFQKNNNAIKINLVDINNFLQEEKLTQIDLIKINIEGSEYDVLEQLIQSDYINNIKNIQVQFHKFVENAENRRNEIRKKLSETHYETYCYEFVWENWRLK